MNRRTDPEAVVTLRAMLQDEVLDRSKLRRVKVSYPEKEKLEANLENYARVYVGASSITVMTTGTKYVCYDQWPVPDAELARHYLRLVYRDHPPVPRCGPRHPGWSWRAPIHAIPVRHEVLAYVDIRSAFWELVSVYRPDDLVLPSGVLPGEAEWLWPDEVAADRELRHCIVGCVFSNTLRWLEYGRPRDAYCTSPWSNPTLKALCMQSLHALGAIAERWGILFAFLTDAAIVEAHHAPTLIDAWRTRWQVDSRLVAQGTGTIFSATSYIVGPRHTLNFDPRTGHETPAQAKAAAPLRGLRRVPGERLRQERMRRLAA